jgi:DNA-binding LytR/AlgR family response regulator
MSHRIKILVVEDEAIIAMDLEMMLLDMGYHVVGCAQNHFQAISLLNEHRPDIVLLDIFLKSSESGIETAAYINENQKIPFIFISSYSDSLTLGEAKKTNPAAYLVKPFKQEDIFAAIEVALANFSKKNETHKSEFTQTLFNDCIFVKQKDSFVKIPLAEVLCFSTEKNYLDVISSRGKYVIRNTLSDMMEELKDKPFIRIHKSHAVNSHHVSEIRYDEVILTNGAAVPLGRAYRESLLDSLKTHS